MLAIFVLKSTTIQKVVSFCHSRIYFLYIGNCFMKHPLKKTNIKGKNWQVHYFRHSTQQWDGLSTDSRGIQSRIPGLHLVL